MESANSSFTLQVPQNTPEKKSSAESNSRNCKGEDTKVSKELMSIPAMPMSVWKQLFMNLSALRSKWVPSLTSSKNAFVKAKQTHNNPKLCFPIRTIRSFLSKKKSNDELLL